MLLRCECPDRGLAVKLRWTGVPGARAPNGTVIPFVTIP
jgi:hypothetical protein